MAKIPKPKSRKSEKSTPKPVAVKLAEAELPRIFDQLDRLLEEEKNRKRFRLWLFNTTENFQAPLPPPDDFEKYNQVLEAVDRILTVMEKEQRIRSDSQAEIHANDRRRIYASTFLGVCLLIVAGIAVLKGYAVTSAALDLAGSVNAIFRHLTKWIRKGK